MKRIICIALVATVFGPVQAQKLKKADKLVIQHLTEHVNFLADDKLEGRRAGTPGEELARTYISKQFQSAGLEPGGANGNWFQPFQISDGKNYGSLCYLFIDDHEISKDHFFPHPLSPEKTIEAMPSMALKESGVPWFLDLGEEVEANKNNPHFDSEQFVLSQVIEAAKKGASALIIYNNDSEEYHPKEKGKTLPIPVVFIDKDASKKYLADETATLEVKLKTGFSEMYRTANNVIGFINNNAPYTIVIGAHYDHLGRGEDGNSMLRTSEKLIHNGADDNASGTAALIELARLLKSQKKPGTNYLLIAFSGEELGLLGSKYYTENPTRPLNSVSYMINMDMVGKLNSEKSLNIGGVGTSAAWSTAFSQVSDLRNFSIKYDSSGTGPSDHTSFYRKDIPVLFFFTGLHSDYHKPTDDADKLNYEGEYRILQLVYNIIKKVPAEQKISFTKTRESQTATTARFSVTLGIMPDYSFSGNGVRIDGVSDNRPAKIAGLQAGDIIVQLGEHSTLSVEEYMQALSKFKKGDKTTVKYKRGVAEQSAEVQF